MFWDFRRIDNLIFWFLSIISHSWHVLTLLDFRKTDNLIIWFWCIVLQLSRRLEKKSGSSMCREIRSTEMETGRIVWPLQDTGRLPEQTEWSGRRISGRLDWRRLLFSTQAKLRKAFELVGSWMNIACPTMKLSGSKKWVSIAFTIWLLCRIKSFVVHIWLVGAPHLQETRVNLIDWPTI